MKNLRYLSGVILVITAFLFAGCYTQIAMNTQGDNGGDNYGYGNDQGYQNENDQSQADSLYGDQYNNDQNYNSNDSYGQDYFQNPWSLNIYYGYPSFSRYPFWRYSYGFGWGSSFFDANYWDPFGLWTSYYPGYWGPYPYYPTYYDPYYSPYYGGNWFYNNGRHYVRSNQITRQRNDNGRDFRGDRNSFGRPNYSGTYSPSARAGSNSRDNNSARVNSTRSSDRNQGRSSSYNRTRNDNGRNSRSYSERRSSSRPEQPAYTRPDDRRSSSSGNSGRSSYSPPSRSYSPPARTYSAPRSSSPPPARSSGGSRSSSGGSDRNRGR